MRTCQIIREIDAGEMLTIRLFIPAFAVDDADLVQQLALSVVSFLDSDNPCRIANAIMSQIIYLEAVEVMHADGYGCIARDDSSRSRAEGFEDEE